MVEYSVYNKKTYIIDAKIYSQIVSRYIDRAWTTKEGGRRGLLREKLGAGVRPASQNTYPVYDKICDFKYPIYVLTLNQDPVSDLPYN